MWREYVPYLLACIVFALLVFSCALDESVNQLIEDNTIDAIIDE